MSNNAKGYVNIEVIGVIPLNRGGSSRYKGRGDLGVRAAHWRCVAVTG